MGAAIACVGDSFEGYCNSCGGNVSGTLTSGEFVTIDGKSVCVTGSTGTGDCGHTCTVVGGSEVLKINGNAVARVGDSVTGTIEGTITSGSFATSD